MGFKVGCLQGFNQGANWQIGGIGSQVGNRKRAAASAQQHSCQDGGNVFGMTRNKIPQRLAVDFGHGQQRKAVGFGACQKLVDEIHAV